ncbi:SDR family oxidoreductase [Pseudomonas sp. D2-3]
MTQRNILVTGATGFLGSALIARLICEDGFQVMAGVRADTTKVSSGITRFLLGDIGSSPAIEGLAGVSVIVHCAARAHIMKDSALDPLSEFRRVNVKGTVNLALQAADAGVKRFIFISSIKVNGESTNSGRSFSVNDAPAPEDPYGISKMEAENALISLARKTGMEVVIIRAPLIYGPGVRGNFASMCELVAKGYPLPFGAIRNQRSLVAIDNLVDLIVCCIDHPSAANEIFIAGDGEDLSTSELLRRVANAMGRSSRLIPVPGMLLKLGGRLLGKRAVAQRLLGSLQVDISKTRVVLGWEPPLTVNEGLQRCFRLKRDNV